MRIAIAVSVLLVLLPEPFDCRRFSAPAVSDLVDQVEPVVPTVRVDLLDPNEVDPVEPIDYEQITKSNTDRSGYGFSFLNFKQKKKRNFKKTHDDNGKVWAKFHNKKNLVEIVPLKNNLTLNKTLAYILPKINKKARILEGFIREQKPDVSDSSEANYSSELNDVISSHSSSSESSSDERISYNQKIRPSNVLHTEINHKQVMKQRVNFTDTINEKIHDLLWFIKNHGGNENLIHEFSVENDESPNYNVHYIAHGKEKPTKQMHVKHKLSEHVIHNYDNKISIPQTQEEYYDNTNENSIINPDESNSDDQTSEILYNKDDDLGVDLNEFSPEHETLEINEELVNNKNEELHHHHHNHHVPHLSDQELIHTLQEKEDSNELNHDILYEIDHDLKSHGLNKFIHNHEHGQHYHDGHQNLLEEKDKLTSKESIDNNNTQYDTVEVNSIDSDKSNINSVESEETSLNNHQMTNIQDNNLDDLNYDFRDGNIEPTSEFLTSNSDSMNDDFSSIDKDDMPHIKLTETANSLESSSNIGDSGTKLDEYIIKQLSSSEESHSDNANHVYSFDDLEETQEQANDDATAEELLLNEDHESPLGLSHHHNHETNKNNILLPDAEIIKDCCELKKGKHLHDCLRHKSYKLTFLFNR